MKRFSRLAHSICQKYSYKCSDALRPILGSFQTQKSTFCSLNQCTKHLLQSKPLRHKFCCNYISSDGSSGDNYPDLTSFPIYVWPTFFNTLRNFLFAKFYVQKYIDEDFDLDEFIEGSKAAVEIVSRRIADGELRKLDGLVTSDVIEEIRRNLRQFSLKQRLELAVDKKDIIACYTHYLGIILPDDYEKKDSNDPEKKATVEMTMTYHVLRGYGDSSSPQNQSSFRVLGNPDFERNLFVLTYRFAREYTKGQESFWIINALNHGKPLADKAK